MYIPVTLTMTEVGAELVSEVWSMSSTTTSASIPSARERGKEGEREQEERGEGGREGARGTGGREGER